MPAKNKIQLQQQWTQTKSDLSSKCYKREHVKYKHTHKKKETTITFIPIILKASIWNGKLANIKVVNMIEARTM